MPKRRPETPSISDQPSRKRLSQSLSTLAAKASSEALRYQPSGSFLNVFMPSTRHNSSTRRSLTPSPLPKLKVTPPAPLTPGLTLSNRLLTTHLSSDTASIKEVLLFPTSLAVLSTHCTSRFTINTTPQLGPPLPPHIEGYIFQKYITGLLPQPERKISHLHLGSATLTFPLNFYLVLPNAHISATSAGSGHLPYRDIQLIYDVCIRPALDIAYPKLKNWASWTDAKNESHVKPLRQQQVGMGSCCGEALQERVHCEGLGALWDVIMSLAEDERVIGLMEGVVLVAFGGVKRGDGWAPSWAGFKRVWDEGVDGEFLGGGERFVVEMGLGMGGTGGV